MSAVPQRLAFRDLLDHGPSAGRVLVVDDERPVREGIERLIRRFGHTVKTAASAEKADHWLASHRFDLCLLDVDLPKMKGVEFLEWALGRDPEMAVIMLTGIDDPELALRCMERGARTYLVKPVEAEFLHLAVRDALAVRTLLIERNDGLDPPV